MDARAPIVKVNFLNLFKILLETQQNKWQVTWRRIIKTNKLGTQGRRQGISQIHKLKWASVCPCTGISFLPAPLIDEVSFVHFSDFGWIRFTFLFLFSISTDSVLDHGKIPHEYSDSRGKRPSGNIKWGKKMRHCMYPRKLTRFHSHENSISVGESREIE